MRLVFKIAGMLAILVGCFISYVAFDGVVHHSVFSSLIFIVIFVAAPVALGLFLFQRAQAIGRTPDKVEEKIHATGGHPKESLENDWSGRGIFDALVRDKPNTHTLPHHLLYANLCSGMGLWYFGALILETPESDWTLVKIVLVVLALFAVLFFGLIHHCRKEWSVRRKEWIIVVLIYIGIVFPVYPCLNFLNAIGKSSPKIVYSGPIVRMRDKKETSSLRGGRATSDISSAIATLVVRIALLPLYKDKYYVVILDDSTKEEVELKVPQALYENLHVGALYNQSMRPGLLGVPYRWFGDRTRAF